VQPIIPPNINNGIVLFFAILVSVLGGTSAFLGGISKFKDTVDFFQTLSDDKNKLQRTLNHPLYITKNRAGPLQYETEHGIRFIFGKCQKPPFAEHNLWFVNIPSGREHTYIVDKQFANKQYIKEFGTNLASWESVANKSFTGAWNLVEECLWEHSPFYVYQLTDGTPIRYGYTLGQSKQFPDRELWYVVLGVGEKDPTSGDFENVFIVDKECTSPEFMEKMGSDPERWRLICWDAPVGVQKPSYGSQVSRSTAPDIYWIFKQDEKDKGRSLWYKWRYRWSSKFRESERMKDLMEKYLR
jgi:hypothetical protein